jgi:Flp pilus assembly CpaF family ATPase
MHALETTLSPAAVVAVTRLLASQDGQSLAPAVPFVSCVLRNGFRYHGALAQIGGGPNVSDGPSFSIRAHARMVRPLADFMAVAQAQLITRAIAARRTALIAGPTNSGKTTLINALIAVIPVAERLLIIEDTSELQPRTGNVVRRFATTGADLKRQVFESLRDRPDRIIIGEVRGSEARDLLEAAATGHPGLSSIHAGSCDKALARLARLAGCDRRFVHETIDLVLMVNE